MIKKKTTMSFMLSSSRENVVSVLVDSLPPSFLCRGVCDRIILHAWVAPHAFCSFLVFAYQYIVS